jgi:hypothetical protein
MTNVVRTSRPGSGIESIRRISLSSPIFNDGPRLAPRSARSPVPALLEIDVDVENTMRGHGGHEAKRERASRESHEKT